MPTSSLFPFVALALASALPPRPRPGVRVFEVGISYLGRGREEGKKIGWRDGVRAVWCIGKYGVLGR